MTGPAENAARKQRGKPFRKGESGNPAGKPPGTRHALTILAEKLMAEDAEAVTRAVIDKAKSGDMVAARLVLERIAPIRRGRPIEIDLPELSGPDSVMEAQRRVVTAVAKGELTPEEGAIVADILEAKRKAIETNDHEARLAAIEAKETSNR